MCQSLGMPPDATTLARQARILVVEDEPAIATQIAHRLTAEGWLAETAHDGPAGVAAAARMRPDVMVLDVMLPGFDGLEVCRRVQADQDVAVLMLTARDAETDILVGLGVGADDYLTKPFSMRELVARIKALLRRTERLARLAGHSADAPPTAPPAPQQLGDLTIDSAQRRVRRHGVEVHLTPTEFDLLAELATSPRTVVSRERLWAEVWDWEDASGTRTVDSHIKALRRKLGADLLRTVHGVGYALEPTGESGPPVEG